MMSDGQGARISYLEKKLQTLEKISKQSAENLEALEAKFSQKIEFLESKVAALESKYKEDEMGENYYKETKRVETNTYKYSNIFICDIFKKEFNSSSKPL